MEMDADDDPCGELWSTGGLIRGAEPVPFGWEEDVPLLHMLFFFFQGLTVRVS